MDSEAISILMMWTMIVVGVPGVIYHHLFAKRIREPRNKILAWVTFGFLEVVFHVYVVFSLIQGWTI